MHVWLFNPQHNLPGNSDTVEEVVDEAHIVDECVHVTGAQHQKCGDTLHEKQRTTLFRSDSFEKLQIKYNYPINVGHKIKRL